MVRKKEVKNKEYITTIADPVMVLVEHFIKSRDYESATLMYEIYKAMRRNESILRVVSLVEEVLDEF